MKIIAVDIGGTSIKSGLFTDGVLGHKRNTPNDGKLGAALLLQTTHGIIESYGSCNGIAISTAGQVDTATGTIRYANENIPQYTGTNLRQIFGDAYGVPVAVENDVNAAALGEFAFGAAKGHPDFLCLTYGTGVGGAIVLDGKIFRGIAGSAGEFGHIITHGKQGGFYEKYASTSALIGSVSLFRPDLTDGREIMKQLTDPRIKSAFDAWVDEVLFGLAGLIHIFNPGLIVLGGGIMDNHEITDAIRCRLPDYIMPSYADVSVVPAQLGNDAGLYGAYHVYNNL